MLNRGFYINEKLKFYTSEMGIGDWGLGIGDWGLGPIPNPQTPIHNPQSPIPNIMAIQTLFYYKILKKYNF